MLRVVAVLFLALPATVVGQENDEQRFLRAWFQLEDPSTVAQAEEGFRALLEREDLAERLRGRASLGLARAERLRGAAADASRRLESLVAGTRDDAVLHRMVLRELGVPRWFEATRVVPAQAYLDLDTGGYSTTADPHPRGGYEMQGAQFRVPTQPDPDFGAKVAPMSMKPWVRLRTDEGHLCWVQVLATAPQTVVRFVTRVGGYGDVLPAPREPFCIGYNAKIEVWWRPDAKRYVRYRVEKRTGPEGEWREAGAFDAPPFVDRDIAPGARYGYRIVGLTANGLVGLPVSLQGTVRSRGVTSGSIELRGGRQQFVDLLRGSAVARGWDLQLVNVWPQGAMFRTYMGSNVAELGKEAKKRGVRSPWDVIGGGQMQLRSGSEFIVPLRGGGVARCRVKILARQQRGRYGLKLDYWSYGDSDLFPAAPTIVAEETEGGVRVKATVRGSYRIPQVEVREAISQRGPWIVPLDRDGVGLDTTGSSEDLREYTATGIDAHGRRTPEARTVLVRMPDRPVRGEFKIHYQQGYSVEKRKVVAVTDADIYIQQANNRLNRIYLYAPRGLTNMRNVLSRSRGQLSEEQMFERIAGVDEATFGRGADYLWARETNKGDGVFITRTEHGGWVKFWIAGRQKSGSWTRQKATIRFVYNPRAPRFLDAPGELTNKSGVLFSELARIEEQSKLFASWKSQYDLLWRDKEFVQRMREVDRAGGVVAAEADAQEVLQDESRFRNSTRALFSFSLARRDPPTPAPDAKEWDLKFHNDNFVVRLSPARGSRIRDLGRLHWATLRRAGQLLPRDDNAVRVRFGHLYLLERVLDGKAQEPVLLRVTGLEPTRRVQFEWVMRLASGKLKTSPGLQLDDATGARIAALLADRAGDETAIREVLGSDEALTTFRRIGALRLGPIGYREVKLSTLAEKLTTASGLRFVFEGDAGTRSVPLLRSRAPVESLLYDVADGAQLVWTIDAAGRIVFRPRQLTEADRQEIARAEERRKALAARERQRRIDEERKKKLAELGDIADALRRAKEALEAGKR